MSMPLWVGIFIGIISLVCFTGWFFNLAVGLKEIVLDDQFFTYRIIAASSLCIALFAGSFLVLVKIDGGKDYNNLLPTFDKSLETVKTIPN